MLSMSVHPQTAGKKCEWKFTAVVTALFTILTLIRTWPLTKMMDAVVGGDGYVFVNGFWWVAKAFSEGRNPFFSDHLFFPDGVSLAFHTVTFSNAFLFLPVTKILGANVAVNSSYILCYILTACFTYLLARDLTGSRLAAFFAGLIVSFGPYHMSSGTHHLNLTTIQWLILYAIMLRRCMTRTDKRTPILAGIVAALVVYTDHYQAILAVLMTLIYAVYHLAVRQGRENLPEKHAKEFFLRLAVIAVTAIILVSPYAYAVLRDLAAQKDITSFGIFDTGGPNALSGDLLGYFTPYPLGNYFNIYAASELSARLYLGILPMAAALYGTIRNSGKPWVKLLLLLAAVSFILSLGPTLHIKGVWQWGGSYLPLPYYWLFDWPPFSMIRTPYRFHLVTLICTALLAAAGIASLLEKFSSRACRYSVVTVAVLILLLDFPAAPYQGKKIPLPAVHRQIAADNLEYSVLELPLSRWAQVKNGIANPSTFMYYQSVHGKKIFSGLITRATLDKVDFKDQFLELLCDLSTQDRLNRDIFPGYPGGPAPLSPDEAEQLGSSYGTNRDFLLNKYNIGYVLLYEYTAPADSLSARFMKGFLGRIPECEGGVCSYRLTQGSGSPR